MRVGGWIVVLAVLTATPARGMATAVTDMAGGFSIKMSFNVSAYPSDQNITGITYPVTGDTPQRLDAKSVMLYHFDNKFGRTAYGALCYRATNSVEFEMGFGYNDMQLEVTQHNNLGRWYKSGSTPQYVWDETAFDTQRDNKFSIITIRPGANFRMSSKPRIVPFISVGLDVMIVKAKTTLDHVHPYVTPQGPDYDLNTTMETMDVEGSNTVVGMDLGSGLEFKIAPAISVSFTVAYLFQFQKAFSDFGQYIKDNAVDPGIKAATYYSDGMNVTNVSFGLGMKVYL
ncbi:MAG: hypothetical protein ABR899_07410 [Candidatus Krumholzibacteriaceae bacterium]|jgi:hypothetical protein